MPSPPASDHYDALVLGAGISGLVSASVLLEQGARRIAVVDVYPRAGGNHLDVEIGPYTFDIGSLVFQDDSPLLRHFPELLPLYVPIDPSWLRLNPQGTVTTYPFSPRDDILRAGPVEVVRLLASAVSARLKRAPQRNARDFAEHWLGPRFVHRSGLGSYMERFCGVPTDQIDTEFAQSRMMWIAEHAQVRNLINRVLEPLRRRPAAGPTNQQLARPRSGFAELYAPVVAGLEARGVTFTVGTELKALERTDQGHGDDDGDRMFTLHTGAGAFSAPRVVSTVPVDVALDLCDLREGREPLPTVRLVTLFYSFAGKRGFDSSVFYNFSHEGTWKRLTVYSDFYGPAQEREFFAVEVVSSRGAQTAEQADAAFREHVAANGLLRGDLRLEGSHVLEHAYPIYTLGSGERAREAMAALRAYGVESLGRQGAFQYQPTARHSTLEAEAALRR
ncbi:NAD(P)-binding Rossmann-like domain-containing protein [Quadrisphaera granulorum]|uniref:Putative NAD(P)-binding protein n=2 Tax=Quadrisphaera granulorum TaxID=317664 RepID=A0A316ACZ5_9ACTN|nr:putative NAD(P)-binding protein [Quadrisphaera granulorum]SZE95627.1 NAD(P)-binding Rossmann-like domain-containing protein [Quadrisphaera granulorum]